MLKRIFLLLLVVLLELPACSQDYLVPAQTKQVPDRTGMSVQDYHARYRVAQNAWIGRNVSELLEALGQPDMVLEAVPKGVKFPAGIHVDSYIYLPGPDSNPTCTSAYVVVFHTGLITQYYCR